ncbi:hypothetical protein ES702_02242 [subsurface metagenome]
MNILRGELSRKEMARFAGVESRKVDKSLSRLSDMGYLKYKKIKGGKYKFTLYPEPVKELELRNN